MGRPAARFIDGKKLQFILNEHEKWIKTDGKEGKKAILDNLILRNNDFSNKRLGHSILTDSILTKTIFQNADLREANFVGANLQAANLEGANLQKADLGMSNLLGTNLKAAKLMGANLRRVANLTIEQLSEVETLFMAKIDSELENNICQKYPHLLEKPEHNKINEKLKASENQLFLYIEYKNYLLASQLQDIFNFLDEIYNTFYASLAYSNQKNVSDKIPHNQRLRVYQIHTGNSIDIVLEGIKWIAGIPINQVAQVSASTAAVILTGKILIDIASGKTPKTWAEVFKVKAETIKINAEIEKTKAEVAKLKTEILALETDKGNSVEEYLIDTSVIHPESLNMATDSAKRFIDICKESPNIIVVVVNEHAVVRCD
ncbi:MAG: pentapeptide repeat-containing protein [Methanosarcinaceae archaeon]